MKFNVLKPMTHERVGVVNYDEKLAAARAHLTSIGITDVKPLINVKKKRKKKQ